GAGRRPAPDRSRDRTRHLLERRPDRDRGRDRPGPEERKLRRSGTVRHGVRAVVVIAELITAGVRLVAAGVGPGSSGDVRRPARAASGAAIARALKRGHFGVPELFDTAWEQLS